MSTEYLSYVRHYWSIVSIVVYQWKHKNENLALLELAFELQEKQ